MTIRSATSPLFLGRIGEVTGPLRIVSPGCGAGRRRGAVACESDGGVCALCHAGSSGDAPLPVGTALGPLAVEEIAAAVQAFEARAGQRRGGTIALPWPVQGDGEPVAGARPIALADAMACLADLLEARSPDEEAFLSPVDGTIEIGGERRGKRVVTVHSSYEHEGQRREWALDVLVPVGRSLLVASGDRVLCCAPLTGGWPGPHEVLRILGEEDLGRWILAQARSLFAAVGVPSPGQSLALVVKQMLSRVTIEGSGETAMVVGSLVDKVTFQATNQRAIDEGKTPGHASHTVLGISQLGRVARPPLA